MAVSSNIPRRASRLHAPDVATQSAIYSSDADEQPIERPRGHRTLTVFITTLIIGLCLLTLWVSIVVPWWQGIQDQWHYGSSRITQMDANVGHGGACHFITEYYKGAIVVIEIPYANTNATHTYIIPGIAADGSAPVILLNTKKDSSTGRLDLVVQVAGTNFATVLYNTGSAFSENQ